MPLLIPEAAAADAQFPQRPVRLIVPTSPGGGVDFIARLLARQLSDRWGQNVIVDNRAGAAGLIGLEFTARATPDGYTLVLDNTGHLLTARLTGKLSSDFTPIALPANSPLLFVVHPSVPATSVKELFDLARAKPAGEFNYASAGEGTSSHLGTELLSSMAGIKMTHVPYKGTGPGLPDLLSGKVQVTLTSVAAVTQHVQAGRLHGLAVTGVKRLTTLSQVPTFAEAGYPRFRMSVWYGVFGPAAMPTPVVGQLNADINWAVQQPGVIDRFANAGIEPATGSPAQLADYMAIEAATWNAALKAAGMR
ncbi:MAG: tripartite tricarboxylate transporter substrate binding protein [Betaproteobacteria bacterium]|nr:tripartite tricarboxylate transporter substrate binding protein [Betaproteobacteria bacterium]